MSSKTKKGRKKCKNKKEDVILIKSGSKDLKTDENEAIYISDEDSVCEVVTNNETVKQSGGTKPYNESFLSSIAEMIYKEVKMNNVENNKKDNAVNKIIEESTNNNTINSNYEKILITNEEVDISDDEIVISSDEENVEERLNKKFVYLTAPTVVLSCEEYEMREKQRTWDSIPKVKNKKRNAQEQKNETQEIKKSETSHFYDCDFEDLLDNLKNKNKNGLQEQKTYNSKRPRITARDEISQKPTDPFQDKIGSTGQDQILRKLLNRELDQAEQPASSASAPLVINQGLPMVNLQGVPLPVTYGTNMILVQFFN